MSTGRKALGDQGERLAACYLRGRGYRILQTNYRCRLGEIDLVAQHGDCLVFVEVRTRSSASFGSPEESITPRKASRLVSLAEAYLGAHPQAPAAWRIDVVAIEMARNGQIDRIEVVENAVEG